MRFEKLMEAYNSSYKVKLNNFEGPLDLLLHLIEKNKMDIYDINISEITDQYMDYLYSLNEWDMELSSEFLVMAATLLYIKSRTLLPVKKEEDAIEEDPRAALVSRLIEYRKYKQISKEMLLREQKWMGALYKQREFINFSYDNEIIELNPDTLKEYMLYIVERNEKAKNNNEEKMKRILAHEKVRIKDKMRDILRALKDKTSAFFSEIFNKNNNSKVVIITGFQAMLELSKGKKVRINQKKPFDDIKITRIDNL